MSDTTRTCSRCGLVNPANAATCDCGAQLLSSLPEAGASTSIERRASLLARASPLLLISGALSTCSDCAFNNDFVAYDRNRETILTHLGSAMILVAPVAAIAAIFVNRVAKRRQLPGLSAKLYVVNLGIVSLAAFYSLQVLRWIFTRR